MVGSMMALAQWSVSISVFGGVVSITPGVDVIWLMLLSSWSCVWEMILRVGYRCVGGAVLVCVEGATLGSVVVATLGSCDVGGFDFSGVVRDGGWKMSFNCWMAFIWALPTCVCLVISCPWTIRMRSCAVCMATSVGLVWGMGTCCGKNSTVSLIRVAWVLLM